MMKKIIVFIAFLSGVLGILNVNAKKKNIDPMLQKKAETIITALEKKEFAILVNRAYFNYSVSILDMDKNSNQFVINQNKLFTNIDYVGGRIVHSLSLMQLEILAMENAEMHSYVSTLPPVYRATSNILDYKVKLSKNMKTANVHVRFRITESNYTDFDALPFIDISIDIRDLSTRIQCHGMHCDEAYEGELCFP